MKLQSHFKSVNIIVLIAATITFTTTKLTSKPNPIESFLPTLLDDKRMIRMRSSSNRDVKSNLINIKNFTYVNFIQSCGECKDDFLLIIAVLSYVGNSEGRKIIRETWGQPANCIRTVFFVGITYDNNVMRSIFEENSIHSDIVQGNVEDTYFNLAYKHVMALKWVNQFCVQAKYVIKTDTDVFVRVKKLYELLGNDTWGPKKLIAGYIERHERVQRDSHSVLLSRFVSKTEFPKEYYPTYCWGQFIIYSGDLIPRLVKESKKSRYFKIDDIYVTGILAKRINGIRYVSLFPNWYLSRSMLGKKLKDSDPRRNYVYGPYSLTASEIKELWENTTKIK